MAKVKAEPVSLVSFSLALDDSGRPDKILLGLANREDTAYHLSISLQDFLGNQEAIKTVSALSFLLENKLVE